MKPNFKLLTALILPFFSYAQDKGLDQIIDEKFGEATGWFVDFIFYQIFFTFFPFYLLHQSFFSLIKSKTIDLY